MARPEREVSIVVHLVHFFFRLFFINYNAAYYFFFLSYIHRESILVKINKKKIRERKRERGRKGNEKEEHSGTQESSRRVCSYRRDWLA